MQQVRKREAQQSGDSHPQRKAQLSPVFENLRAKRSPVGCDAAHDELLVRKSPARTAGSGRIKSSAGEIPPLAMMAFASPAAIRQPSLPATRLVIAQHVAAAYDHGYGAWSHRSMTGLIEIDNLTRSSVRLRG